MNQAVSIRLFARARELAGTDRVTVLLPHGGTVADFRRALVRHFPQLADIAARSAVAVNEEYAADGCTIRPTDDVALIPPVSGG